MSCVAKKVMTKNVVTCQNGKYVPIRTTRSAAITHPMR